MSTHLRRLAARVRAPLAPNRRRRRRAARDDRGATLVELIAVIAIMGGVVTVLASSITMILRNHGRVSATVSMSHDRQQTVNYFPGDVAVAPTDPAAFRVDGEPSCGSGTNILSIDYPSDSSVSYVLSTDGTLTRQLCEPGVPVRTVRVADDLAADAGVPARAIIHTHDGEVTEVQLDLFHGRTSGTAVASSSAAEFRATPRSSDQMPPSPPPPAPSGLCDSNNPLDGALGFLSFVEQDVHLGSGSQVYKAIGVGGSFSFSNGAQIAGHGGHPSFTPADVGLYARRVNWTASSGELQVNGNPGHVIIAEAVEDVDLTTEQLANISYIRGPGSTAPPQIKAQNGQLKKEAPGYAVDFPAAFERLRSCSADLYRLPSSCPGCATHIVPLHINANPSDLIPYTGSGDLRISLQPGMTNVLNVTEAQLHQITNTPAWLDTTPNQIDALIVNVIDVDGNGVIDVKPVNFSNYTTKVLWNFHDVHTVNITGGIWGTVFAPDAHVQATGNIQGNLVARSFSHSGGVVNEANAFAGQVRWER